MPLKLLISDANIIIDMEAGDLLRLMFQLDVTFAVPDILFEEELRASHPHLLGLGLKTLELRDDTIAYAGQLVDRHRMGGASTNDLLALALASQEKCPLVTGDQKLRAAGEQEGIEVHGTLWLMERMHEQKVLTARQIQIGYDGMRSAGRRLPWDEVDQQIRRLKA